MTSPSAVKCIVINHPIVGHLLSNTLEIRLGNVSGSTVTQFKKNPLWNYIYSKDEGVVVPGRLLKICSNSTVSGQFLSVFFSQGFRSHFIIGEIYAYAP